MSKLLLWAIPGVISWFGMFAVAGRWLTGERDDKAKYALAPVVLLVWYVPDFLLGITGAAEVEGSLLVVGFPVASIYLATLLLMEVAERRKTAKTES